MKKLLASAILASLVLTACTEDKKTSDLRPELKQDPQSQDISKLPNWVLNPKVDDGIAASGIASPSAGELKFQVVQAETDAKTKIATAAQAEITQATMVVLRDVKLDNRNNVEQAFADATSEVVKNLPLAYSKKVATHQGEDGSLYVHLVLKREDFAQHIKNSKAIYDRKLKKADISKHDLEEAEDAVEDLIDQLD